MDLMTLERAIEQFSEVDEEIGIQTLRAFLFVAARGSCAQKDVELGLGQTNASASRNISYWTDRRFDRKPGKGFIMRVEDPYDRRFRSLTLTQRGREFVEKLRKV